MVETDRGSGHTAGKRGQRSDLRNPEVRRMVRDGKLSISSKIKRIRETRSFSANYSQDAIVKNYAEIETFLHYFDDDWFDFKGLQSHNRHKGKMKGMKVSISNTPMRCISCKKAYQLSKKWTGEVESEYLDPEVFGNMPLEKKECSNCLEKQKNVPLVEDR